MENKTTTELLDELYKLTDSDTGELKDGYYDVLEELKLREPFYDLFHPRSEFTMEEELDDIWEEIKKLKRHKHDTNGDVLIRI